MSKTKSIYAYTQTEGYSYYPGYVNYSQRDGGKMILSVRGTNQEQVQEFELPLSRFWDMVAAVGNFHLPADIEFVPSIFVDELSRKVTELESALSAEQEARKVAEHEALRHKEGEEFWQQRAETAEAIIKASREQEPVGNVITRPLMPDECEAKRIITWYAKQFAGNFYAQPPIPPDVTELQRQLEEARGVPEGWKLVPVEPTDAMIDFVDYEWNRDTKNRTWGDVYKAMISVAPAKETK